MLLGLSERRRREQAEGDDNGVWLAWDVVWAFRLLDRAFSLRMRRTSAIASGLSGVL